MLTRHANAGKVMIDTDKPGLIVDKTSPLPSNMYTCTKMVFVIPIAETSVQ